MKRHIWFALGIAVLSSGLILTSMAARFARADSRISTLAALYTVGNAADTTIGQDCTTALKCTLRKAVELANAAFGGNITISPTVTSITLTSPITLSGGNISIYGSGAGVNSLIPNGNFPALVLNSDVNTIALLWIRSSGSHAGSGQHGVVIAGFNNKIELTWLADLGGDGVLIQGGGGTEIKYNQIGVISSSGQPLAVCTYANDLYGIQIGNSSLNSIEGNIIGCNKSDGLEIYGAGSYGNVVAGRNYIGVTSLGGLVPNSWSGLSLVSGAHNNLIGRADLGGNIIGGNKNQGVLITGASTNTVQLNSIGISGTIEMDNTWDGVAIVPGSQANLIMSNTIEANGLHGVSMAGADTTGNVLQGNIIALQGSDGVWINSGANNNTIGVFNDRSLGNTISANSGNGVLIDGATTHDNALYGNDIGTNLGATSTAGNHLSGVRLDNGTYSNLIGGFTGERNIIGGNLGEGVLIQNGAHDNVLDSNDIGVNTDYLPGLAANAHRPASGPGQLPNGGGVTLLGAFTNTIGGYFFSSPVGNYIADNVHTGIYVAGASRANFIGPDVVLGQGDFGVLLDGSNTAFNIISHTLIAYNARDGLGERYGADNNVWSHVSIYANRGLGIDKYSDNPNLNIVDAPPITVTSIDQGSGVVQGLSLPNDFQTVTVELYRVWPNPSGYGEGYQFVGSSNTDNSGNWSITDTSSPNLRGCYTAFVTRLEAGGSHFSSEFSVNNCRTFLPLVLKNF